MSILIRLGGLLLIGVAVAVAARSSTVAHRLGRPVGWSVLWESFRGKGPVGNAVYEGYSIYTTVAGWLWFSILEIFLFGIGVHLALAGSW